MLARASAGPILVRAGIMLAAAACLLVALPAELVLRPAAVLIVLVLSALPALFPRTRLVGVTLMAAGFGWLIGTYAYGQVITIPRLIGLATAMYLTHSLAALAAALPYDAIVSPGVLFTWTLRAVGIVSASAIVSILLLAVVKLVVGPVYLVASLVGVLAAAALAYLVTRRG